MREPKYKVFIEYTGKTERVTFIGFNVMGQVNRIHTGHTEHVIRGDRDKFHLREFTGLKDKNGAEIYEGDILKFEDCGEEGYEYKDGFDFKNLASVCFTDGRFELENFWSDNSAVLDEMSSNDHETFIGNFGLSEIVGNIYEHPHLLEQADPS